MKRSSFSFGCVAALLSCSGCARLSHDAGGRTLDVKLSEFPEADETKPLKCPEGEIYSSWALVKAAAEFTKEDLEAQGIIGLSGVQTDFEEAGNIRLDGCVNSGKEQFKLLRVVRKSGTDLLTFLIGDMYKEFSKHDLYVNDVSTSSVAFVPESLASLQGLNGAVFQDYSKLSIQIPLEFEEGRVTKRLVMRGVTKDGTAAAALFEEEEVWEKPGTFKTDYGDAKVGQLDYLDPFSREAVCGPGGYTRGKETVVVGSATITTDICISNKYGSTSEYHRLAVTIEDTEPSLRSNGEAFKVKLEGAALKAPAYVTKTDMHNTCDYLKLKLRDAEYRLTLGGDGLTCIPNSVSKFTERPEGNARPAIVKYRGQEPKYLWATVDLPWSLWN